MNNYAFPLSELDTDGLDPHVIQLVEHLLDFDSADASPADAMEAAILIQMKQLEREADFDIWMYWKRIKEGNSNYANIKDQCSLGVRKRARAHSLTFEWFASRPYWHAGELKTKWIHVPKARGCDYNLRTLKRFCVGWEVDTVLFAEEMLRDTRQKVAKLNAIRRIIQSHFRK